MKKHDVAFILGRFQPFHTGHLSLVKKGFEVADNVCLILGSCDRPRSLRNPFTYDERITIIKSHPYTQALKSNIYFLKDVDNLYNHDQWRADLINKIKNFGNEHNFKDMIILDHTKDNSEFIYEDTGFIINRFQVNDTVKYSNKDDVFDTPLSATAIREQIYRDIFVFSQYPKYLQSVDLNIKELKDSLQVDYNYYEKYKADYEALPYPPVFVTVDVVLRIFDHILLIERGRTPGKGLLALPGGFFDAESDVSTVDAAIRELHEETGLNIPTHILKSCIVDNKIFDFKYRSTRGRVISHTFYIDATTWCTDEFDLFDESDIEKIPTQAGDDASKTQFVGLKDIVSNNMFDDHYDIIKYFESKEEGLLYG
jgi:bifunctional NMN adenylyltransferase/nudix hydrolase